MESKDDCAVVTSLELIRLWPRVVLTFEPSEIYLLALAFGHWLRALSPLDIMRSKSDQRSKDGFRLATNNCSIFTEYNNRPKSDSTLGRIK
jgi:hypothetical protein